MKKFYTKISRPQWRITVPNINGALFGKSDKNEQSSHESLEEKAENLGNSGSYDVQEEQQKIDRKSVTESITIMNEKQEDTEDSDEDKYEDASPMLEKKEPIYIDDTNIYADVENIQTINDKTCDSYEYDIPRISFSFFDDSPKSEMEEKPIETKRKSEIKIFLAQPLIEEEDSDSNTIENKINDKHLDETDNVMSSLDDISISATRCEIQLEPKIVEMDLKSLDDVSMNRLSKCDSEPNIEIRLRELEDEEGFYKVPRQHKRLSQSLRNLSDEEILHSVSSTSITRRLEDATYDIPENLSQKTKKIEDKLEDKIEAEETISSLEYCDVRSQLPLKQRRATLLRPHMRSKAHDTWSTFRTKVSNIISTHSAAQRVGANSGDKILNLEEFYKTSRTKCRKIVNNTSKIFNKKKPNENGDNCSDTSSKIVKNDAFFDKMELNEDSVIVEESSEIGDKFGSRMLECEKGGSDFDIGTLKSAFRRSKYLQEIQEVNLYCLLFKFKL